MECPRPQLQRPVHCPGDSDADVLCIPEWIARVISGEQRNTALWGRRYRGPKGDGPLLGLFREVCEVWFQVIEDFRPQVPEHYIHLATVVRIALTSCAIIFCRSRRERSQSADSYVLTVSIWGWAWSGGRAGEGETSESNHFAVVLRAGFSACSLHTKRRDMELSAKGELCCAGSNQEKLSNYFSFWKNNVRTAESLRQDLQA